MRTKIIATVGPSTDSPETLLTLARRGVRTFRLNFSHGSPEDFAPVVKTLREVESEIAEPLTVLQDLAGPKMRLGDCGFESIEFSKGDCALMGPGCGTENRSGGSGFPLLPFENDDILSTVRPGGTVVLGDGALVLKVRERTGSGRLLLEALTPGLVTPRKGVTFPGLEVDGPALTAKDREDLRAGLALGVDMIAVSYVGRPEDVAAAREAALETGRAVPVIAKLERLRAIERLEGIIAEADAVMVARGDLGIECPLPDLPGLQKRIIRACNRAAKPVIVATQMLLSMVQSRRPTRAETTDVANAVLDGADCLMLSEETAIGRFPTESVFMMGEIATRAESLYFEEKKERRFRYSGDSPAAVLGYGAGLLAERSDAQALVCHSVSGGTARLLSSLRPEQPIYALSPDPAVGRLLNLTWGVRPWEVDEAEPDHLRRAEIFIDRCAALHPGRTAVITAGHPAPGETRADTNLLKLYRKPL